MMTYVDLEAVMASRILSTETTVLSFVFTWISLIFLNAICFSSL